MSRAWGKHQFRHESPAPGGGSLHARFQTNGTSDPAVVVDPSGMLTITRAGQSTFTVALPDRWAYIFPSVEYLEQNPAGTFARCLLPKEGSANDPNSVTIRLEDSAGALVADQTAKWVQITMGLYNQQGRA